MSRRLKERIRPMQIALRERKLGHRGLEKALSLLVLLVTGLLLLSIRVRVVLIAVLGLASLAFVALLVLHPLLSACLLTFLAYGQVSAAFIPGAFSGLLAVSLLAWVVRFFLGTDSTISGTMVDLAVLVYVLTLLISVLFSSALEASGPELLLVLKWLLLYGLLVNTVRGEKAAVWTSMFLLAGATLSGLIGLWTFSQERTLIPLGAVFRASGLAGNPNILALLAVTALPLAIYMMIASRKAVVTILFAGVALVLTGANLVTLSRTGIVAMVLVFALVAIRERHRLWVRVAVVGTILVLPALIPPEFWRRAASTGLNIADFSAYLRTGAMTTGITMFKESPLVGTGLGTYLLKSAESGDTIFPLVAHNMYLHVLAESGLVGLAAMLFLIGSSLGLMRRAEKLARRGSTVFYLARGYQISYVAFLASGLLLSIQTHQSFWLFPAASVFLFSAANATSAGDKDAGGVADVCQTGASLGKRRALRQFPPDESR